MDDEVQEGEEKELEGEEIDPDMKDPGLLGEEEDVYDPDDRFH